MPRLNRRIFLQTAGAAAATPALPPMAVAQPAVATTNMQLMWASYLAKVHNASSPAMIAKMMQVDTAVAQSLYRQLLSKGVLLAPNATGLSSAAKPIYQPKAIRGHKGVETLRKTIDHLIPEKGEVLDADLDATLQPAPRIEP